MAIQIKTYKIKDFARERMIKRSACLTMKTLPFHVSKRYPEISPDSGCTPVDIRQDLGYCRERKIPEGLEQIRQIQAELNRAYRSLM